MKKPPAQKTAKTGMETPVTLLPNIGKDTAAKLEKIGIRTAEEFLARDPYLVFEKLRKKVDPTLCLRSGLDRRGSFTGPRTNGQAVGLDREKRL